MLYNKNQFKKVNDKQVLHKIKKHWVTISIALLGLIGGGAVATTNASANTINQTNSNPNQANHSLSTNQQDQQTKLVSNTRKSIHTNHRLQNFTKEANQLHHRIINRATSLTSQSFGSRASSASRSTMRLGAANSASNSTSMNESAAVSSAATSIVAKGGHRISVSPTVRSDMISGASEIASYNQTTKSNAYATADYLESLNTATPELASEKSSAESYVLSFYGNQRAKSDMTMNNEAAHDIRIWGEDPDFFTLYQAEPSSIVNNVRTMYEPAASAYTAATGMIEARVKSLYASQMTSPSSSINNSSESINSVTPQSVSPSSVNSGEASSSNTDITTQDNSQASPSLVGQTASNNYSSSRIASNSNELGSPRYDSSSEGSNGSNDITQNGSTNASREPSADQNASDDSRNSDVSNNENNGQDPTTNDSQPLASIKNRKRTAKGVQTAPSNRQVSVSSTPETNNDPVNASDDSNHQNSSNSKLPQTNESLAKSREAAEISLIMSTTFGALGMYIDKRRHDKD